MKQFSSLALITSLLFLQGCSKDFLKSYDKRVVGTWRIAAINIIGIGGNTDGLPFRDGLFTFENDGTLIYRNGAGEVFDGSWDIEKMFGDEDGTRRTLHITVANHSSQQVLSEYYTDMNFVGTNHFKATVPSGYRTFVTHFRR